MEISRNDHKSQDIIYTVFSIFSYCQKIYKDGWEGKINILAPVFQSDLISSVVGVFENTSSDVLTAPIVSY